MCYRHQTVPESAQIEDCYKESMTDPVYCGEFANVFRGSYRERLVAVKVMKLYSSDREATLRVSVSIMSGCSGGLSMRPRGSAKRR